MVDSLFQRCKNILSLEDKTQKVQQTFQLFHDYHQGLLSKQPVEVDSACSVALPSSLRLVSPKECQTRDMKSLEGRKALIHALAHIEYNAINLALDAAYRFQDMPDSYYEDWLLVAKEEAYHFNLLNTHLNALGADYGDYPAHNGLWELAQKTKNNVIERMGCVPRIMEARGLDVAPQIANKLKHRDPNAASLLDIIMRDEIKHVEIGNRWFNYVCQQNQLDPLITFEQLIEKYAQGVLRPPIEKNSRAKAGFSPQEIDWIEQKMMSS